ncbi:hypothetical protein H0185_22435 [Mesobacillus maritimus]|uniref:Spore germination protein n=2 Tax=Mesobacillus maritimus TaxID=1643336 RepID=A0ABS7KBQ0_9BACI|nr:hypothetical protein [Mesobacillus maritimus]
MKFEITAPQITFEDITVSNIEDNSGVFIGKNYQFYWRSIIKRNNSAFGEVIGNENKLSNNTHIVLNDDKDNQQPFNNNS